MEPEEHIVEKYFQVIEKCLTMTNIPCKKRKEIDLLAINPITGNIFHIEVSCQTGEKNYVKLGKEKGKGIEWFSKEKFEHESVKNKIYEILGYTQYQKILVVYGVNTGKYDTIPLPEIAYRQYGIQVWHILDLIYILKEQISNLGSRDDILRFIELIGYHEKKSRAELNKMIERIRKIPIIEA